MPGAAPPLLRSRPWIALAVALAAAVVAYVRAAPIEPHLVVRECFLDLDSPQNQRWNVDLEARGGGEVRDVRVTVDEPSAEVMNARVDALESRATLWARVLLSPRPARPVTVTVRYTSGGEPRELTVPLKDVR